MLSFNAWFCDIVSGSLGAPRAYDTTTRHALPRSLQHDRSHVTIHLVPSNRLHSVRFDNCDPLH